MTAWGSVESAVEAMRRGARDYVQKPWDNTRLIATLRTQIELASALRRTRRLEDESSRARQKELPELVAESASMKPIMRLLEKVGPSDASVLITGEHGTGKEVIARWIHAASPRSGKPFVAVNAGGLAEGVFESELFGHVRGAFTDAKTDRIGCFELADGGTLFLDEIANMPLSQQSKLLRVLQSGELTPVGSSRVRRVDVRVLAATNVSVATEVGDGRFREDLYYRLNTVEINLPPLRERREDIARLAAFFLARRSQKYNRPGRTFTMDAIQSLLEHSWPGNVRELEHVVERACVMAAGDEIGVEDLMLRPRAEAHGASRVEEMTLEEAERWLIERALARSGGSATDAARALGLSRSAFYRRLAHFGIRSSG